MHWISSLVRLSITRLGTLGLVASLAVLSVFFLSPDSALASTRQGYAAQSVTKPSPEALVLAPGERTRVTVSFQNTGLREWRNDGPGYVSIYTYEPKYRRSTFDPGTWLSPEQVTRMQEPVVLVGKTGTFSFDLHAPTVEGQYREVFHLASEDTAWIPGGQFTLSLTVRDDAEDAVAVTPAPTVATLAETSVSGYEAAVLIRSAKEVVAKGGEEVTYKVGIQNRGTQTWETRAMVVPALSIANTVADLVHHSWDSSTEAVVVDGAALAPQGFEFIEWTFRAPKTKGTHAVTFYLQANGEIVPGGTVTIPVTVTENSPDAVQSGLIDENADGIADRAQMVNEPKMRVAILIVDEETNDEIIVSCDCEEMSLQDDQGNLLVEGIGRGQTVRAYYDGKYYFDAGRGIESSNYPIRFIPSEDYAVMTIENWDRRVTRGASYKNNRYRHILEMRYNTTKDRTWVINELPMEYYLRGLAETSNLSHIDFQRALITAARTYALFHWERQTKHRAEGYIVDAYRDQVYWGYDQEERMPNLAEAIQDTQGVVVTYNGATAITPYFSRSDGRTRDWSDVWGGDQPHVRGVAVPCDVGKTLWGHGVGMSASGAICMAKDGTAWDDILHYFYTGIELERGWRLPEARSIVR